MIQMIKKNWSVLLLLLTVFAVSASLIEQKDDDKIHLTIKAFSVANGWGYDVLTNDSIYIHQQYIPAVAGNKVFTTKEQATIIGMLVMNKLKQKQSPTISLAELDSCSIQY
jgi:hypothetical protein